MEIKVEQLQNDKLNALDVSSWPTWQSPVCEFDWHYDSTELAYILEGRVIVVTSQGEVEIKKGDYVTFPEGLSCKWKVLEAIKKHYKFI